MERAPFFLFFLHDRFCANYDHYSSPLLVLMAFLIILPDYRQLLPAFPQMLLYSSNKDKAVLSFDPVFYTLSIPSRSTPTYDNVTTLYEKCGFTQLVCTSLTITSTSKYIIIIIFFQEVPVNVVLH